MNKSIGVSVSMPITTMPNSFKGTAFIKNALPQDSLTTRAMLQHVSDLSVKRPRLKEIIAEATNALANIDARRLESLVENCRILFEKNGVVAATGRPVDASEALEAKQDLLVLSRLIEQTREHLHIYKRVREMHWRRSGGGYSEREVASGMARHIWFGPRIELEKRAGKFSTEENFNGND